MVARKKSDLEGIFLGQRTEKTEVVEKHRIVNLSASSIWRR